jgi:hypothetical protein
LVTYLGKCRIPQTVTHIAKPKEETSYCSRE